MDIHPKTEQAYRLLHDGTLALARAEQQGIRVDMEYTTRKKEMLTKKIGHLFKQFQDTKFYRHWDHTMNRPPNINSNAQLAHFLYDVKKLEPARTTTSGQGSTDEDTLLQLGIPELNDLIQIRKLRKIRDTYLDSFIREQVNGYLHPSFNLHLVKTFRSSSDRPNFQNIPKRDKESMQLIRKALYPRPGHRLLEVDYKGLEVRIAACYHKDSRMLKYIRDPATDMHGDMAEQIFLFDFNKASSEHETLRAAAKNGFVFPQFYGDWYKACAINLACNWGKLPQGKWISGQGMSFNGSYLSDHLLKNGMKSIDKFIDHIQEIEHDFWANRFPEYARWKEVWWHTYKKYGHIDMLTGFRCSGVMGRNDAINYPVQGAAFHCLLWSFIELDRIMRMDGWKTRLIGQIHDAIVFDVHPEELERVTYAIRKVTCEDLPKQWPWIIVPLEVEMDICPVDGSWAEKEEYVLKN